MGQSGAEKVSEATETRARIRDAAMRQFAEHGFTGASVRAIATDAGVSPGLVQHYFPTKQDLRSACDEHVLAVMRDIKGQVSDGPESGPGVASAQAALLPIGRYIATMLLEDSESSSRGFDQLSQVYRAALTDGEIGPPVPDDEDLDAIVAVLTAQELGLSMLVHHIHRQLGVHERDPAAVARIGRARLYLVETSRVHPEVAEHVRRALDHYQHGGSE